MGATGSGILRRRNASRIEGLDFIPGARQYTGSVTRESSLEAPGEDRLTLRLPSYDRQDVLFQFRIKNGMLIIRAYDPNTGMKTKVEVNANNPSLDVAARTGDHQDRVNVQKLRTLMNKSSNMNESQLGPIADMLKKNRTRTGRVTKRG